MKYASWKSSDHEYCTVSMVTRVNQLIDLGDIENSQL